MPRTVRGTLAAIAATSRTPMTTHVCRVRAGASTVTMAQRIAAFTLAVASAGPPGLFAAADLRELARQLARERPGEALNLPKAPADLPQRSIEEVARHPHVVLIVEATLARRGDSYLSADGQAVLTDYTVTPVRVFADRQAILSAATPGAATPIILTRWGGEVVFEGVPIRCTDSNDRPIREDGMYFLFLSRSRPPQPGRYEDFGETVFEIADGHALPLFRDAHSVFRGTIDTDANDFRRRIENAVR